MGNEMTPEDMFNKMMEDQARMIAAQQAQQVQPQTVVPQQPQTVMPQGQPVQPQTVVPQGQPGEPPVLDAKEQMVLNELQNRPAVANTGSHPSQVVSSLPQCPSCGMFHPPVRPGETCGNAPAASGNVADLDMEINKLLVNLKNIAMSQIQSKGIKNINKLLQYIAIEMTKLLEGYNE